MNVIPSTTYFDPWSKGHHGLGNFTYLSIEEKIAVIALTLFVSIVSVGIFTIAIFRLLTDSTEPTQKFAKRIANYVIQESNLETAVLQDVTFTLQKTTLSLTKQEWESLDRRSFYSAIEAVFNNSQWDTFAVPEVGTISRVHLETLIQSGFLAELQFLLLNTWQHDIDVFFSSASSLSPLQQAVFVGRVDLAKAFSSSYSIDQTCSRGFTPLHYATFYSHEEMIHLLLDQGADINCTTTTSPPLQMAKNPKIAKLLLDRGADLEQICQSGVTPLVRAILEKKYALARFFRQQGARMENAKGVISPLTFCLFKNDLELAKFVFTLNPDLNILDATRHSLLIKAVHQKNIPFVQLLLDHGANINVQGENGNTPLHHAVWQENTKLMALLLDRGAAMDLKNIKGYTPLHLAARKGHLESIRLLLKRGAAVDSTDYLDKTPLMHAACSGNMPSIQRLLKKGASIYAKDLGGNTALLYALLNGHATIFNLFIKKDPSLLLEINFNQLTPFLHIKLKANATYKQMKLLFATFPFAQSLSREILYRKFLGHFFSLKGSNYLHPNHGNHSSLSLELDGIIPNSYGNKQLKKSLKTFCHLFPQALPENFKAEAPPLHQEASASDLYAQWKKGKLIQLAAGFSEHMTGCYVKGNRFILVNKGQGHEGKIVRIWHFNPKCFSEKIIEQIQDLKDKTIDDYTQYMHKELPQALQCRRSVFEASLEDHFNNSFSMQAVGNCSVINPQAAWQVLFQWDYVRFKGFEDTTQLKDLLKESERLSQAILVFEKCLYIHKYLHKKSPHFLPSPLLLAEINYMLKRVQELNLPHIDKILHKTINRIDKQIVSLNQTSIGHLSPKAQKKWKKELKKALAFKKDTEEYLENPTSCCFPKWLPLTFWDLEPSLEAEGWATH